MAHLHQLSAQAKTPVYVCTGKDCRKKMKKLRCLESTIEAHGDVLHVGCQKICKGPVVGLELDGRIEWFGKLGEKSAQQHLVLLLTEGKLVGKLKARIAKKRRGKFRGEMPLAAK